jgi:hypothetical protein
MIVYSYKDGTENYTQATRSADFQDGDLFHLGDYQGVHYFSYNPDTVTLAANTGHDQKEYTTDAEKADLAEVLPSLIYVQSKIQTMKNEFLSQYDAFELARLTGNSNAAFKSAINAKHDEINSYITSLGF